MLKSKGIIRYSPTNNGKLERRDGGTTEWWMILDCDPQIGFYYRKLYKMASFGVHTINRPVWDAHVSIISNEKPLCMDKWRIHDGKRIEFEYEHFSLTNGTYVWQVVHCPILFEMREELGLKRNPWRPFHLTVGNNK